MEFTGERVVPGAVDADLWAEHLSRYVFAEPLAVGRRVLDLGTGAGYGAQRLAAQAARTVGLDISTEAIRHARGHHAAERLDHVAGDAARLPFGDASFDLVVCFEVIEHLAAQEELLREVRRVLAPDGIFVVSTPNKAYYTDERHEQNEFHVREFEVPEFAGFLRREFPNVELFLQNHVPAVTIEHPGDVASSAGSARTARGRVDDAQAATTACHYAVAICSAAPVALDGIVFFSEGTSNVLRERERHVALLQAELERTRADYARVEREWQERTTWAQSLDAELAGTRAAFSQLQERLAAAELARVEAERAHHWWRRVPGAAALARRARDVGSSTLLPAIAAAATVPLAAAIGAGALAAEGVARLLPRAPRLPSLAPPDPTLATLLILNFDGKDLLAKNIPHLQDAVARTGRPHQILVVDNGSTDGSAAYVRAHFPDVDVVELERNWFFSAGNDLGIPHARHDIVVLLNNDMRVEPDFLEPLLRPFAERDGVFAVASRIRMAGERREETGLTRGRFARGLLQLRHDPVPDDGRTRPVPILWAGGGAAAFDKRKFVELGGLDLLYDPFYCEDLDLSLRAWSRGWDVLFAPDSVVWHDHRTTSRRVFGESYVDETVRRNTLLVHWASVLDLDLLAAHLAMLPANVFAQTRRHGASGVRSVARAAARAPRALLRRLRQRGEGPPIRDVLELTDAGVSPGRFSRRVPAANEPLRITMLAPYHLLPRDHGGAVRMYEVVRELARRGNRVSVVGFVDTEAHREAGKQLEEFCEDVSLVVRQPPDGAPGLLSPPEVREFDHSDMRRAVLRNLAEFDPDVVQIEYTHMAPYGRLARDRVRCLTEHDVAFVSAYRTAAAEKGLAAAYAYEKYLMTFHHELEALRDFDVVFTASEREAELLRAYQLDGVHISGRAPNPVDVDAMRSVERRPERDLLLFVGNFAHRPNVDAVSWFARHVLPLVHQQIPEARLVVAGPHAPPAVKDLARDARVEVAGYVPDLAPLYARAAAVVSPIRFGAGVRVKLLEAFAARVPVVSTSLGAEGIGVEAGRDLLIADDPEAFAREAVRLLRDRALGARLAESARALVERRYAVTAVAEAIEDEYRRAIERKQRGRISP